jgi:D-3-phosphoglycerate dehydrogenase
VLTADVADMAVALLLSVARKVPTGIVRKGNWAKGSMPLVARVNSKPVGVVGMRRVGTAAAKRLAAFDCEVAYLTSIGELILPTNLCLISWN